MTITEKTAYLKGLLDAQGYRAEERVELEAQAVAMRIKELMAAIDRVLPDARVSLSCDLTKLHELTIRGVPREVLAMLEANEKAEKGEYCMVLDLRMVPREEEKAVNTASPEAQILECMLNGMELREAREKLMENGVKKNIAYAAAIRVKNWLEGEE